MGIRIEHVITRLIVGGAQENTLSTVLYLRKIPQLEVTLTAGPSEGPEGSLESLARAQKGLFHLEPRLVRPVSPLSDLSCLLSLTRRFQRLKPQIVHTHSGKAGLIGRMAAAFAGVPVVFHTIHGPSFGAFQGAGALEGGGTFGRDGSAGARRVCGRGRRTSHDRRSGLYQVSAFRSRRSGCADLVFEEEAQFFLGLCQEGETICGTFP